MANKFEVGDKAKFHGDVVVIVSVDDTDIPYLISEPGYGKIGWVRERELSPLPPRDPRVRYCVAADLPTSITVWHDTFESADAEAQRLCVKCGKPFRVLKVVEEVKPGKPVITKLEE